MMIRVELAIGRIFAPQTSQGWHCQGSSSFDTRPVVESVARARLLAAALMPAEPHIRSPFSERLAPQSLILEVIGLGRAGPHCMAAYHSHCLRRSARPDPTGLIRPRGTRDNDPVAVGQPLLGGGGLALRAVPVAAGVVGDTYTLMKN